MGYGYYEIDGVDRGYMVDDVCNHPECLNTIHRGLAHLCYNCTKYFCSSHLTWAYNSNDKEILCECFAGSGSQVCHQCKEEIKADEVENAL